MDSELLDCGTASLLAGAVLPCGMESGPSGSMVSRLFSSGTTSEQTGVGMVSQPESSSLSPPD